MFISATSRKRGIPVFIKESFINKPEIAVPLVSYPLCKYYCENQNFRCQKKSPAVIILKFEQCGFSRKKNIQKM